MAAFAQAAQGVVLISINNHPDIMAAYAGLYAKEASIRYTAGVGHAAPTGEFIICNRPFDGSIELVAPSGHEGLFALQPGA